MGPPDPITSDPDDVQEAQRLRAFFSAASARHLAEDHPLAPAPAPAPAPGPPPAVPASPYAAPVGPANGAEDVDDRPPPTGPPVLDTSAEAAEAPLDPNASVDVARMISYLDAQLELTRRRADEGVAKVLRALAAIDGRVAELETFRADLFEWLEGYVAWEADALAQIAGRVSGTLSADAPRPQGNAPSV
jgi:hypothetical protein